MNEIFSVPMNYIMVGLLIVLAIALSSVGWVVLRNRVMFMIGVRNIPRRRAQTVLIVIGLMLSTLIISTAFSIGDTVDYSITSQAYDRLHSIDEIVQVRAGDDDDEGDPFQVSSLVSAQPIPSAEAERLMGLFRAVPGVDGVVSVIRGPVPVRNARAGQTEPTVILVGVDGNAMTGFEDDIETLGGRRVSVTELADGEAYVNESAADELDIRPGDRIEVFVGGQPATLIVKDLVRDRVLTGAVFGVTQGIALDLPGALLVGGGPDEIDLVAVSNEGGVRSDLTRSKGIAAALNEPLEGTPWRAATTKKNLVEQAAEVSSFMVTFFVLLGLFAIAAGMLLIFLIFVMLAAERRVEMGMIRAVGTKRRHLIQMFMSEGMAYNVLAAAVGCALGIAVSLVMVRIMAVLFAAFDVSIKFHVTPRSLVVSYSLGVVLTFLTVVFSSWRISSLNIVAAIREISDSASKRPGLWSLSFGIAGCVVGALLMWLGWVTELAFPFGAGWSLFVVGGALVLRFAGLPARPVFTAMGLVMLFFWLLFAGNNVPGVDRLDGDIEMFFLSGVTMVIAGTFVLVYNADLMLALLTRVGGRFSRILPSIRTAVAYPMANKFRTGMTIAMISLVMFALVMMSTMNANFDRLFLSDEAEGGYEVVVTENPNNPIDGAVIAAVGGTGGGGTITGVDDVRLANNRVAEVRPKPKGTEETDWEEYGIAGPTESFIESNEVTFDIRARGLETDADVWAELARNPNAALIDSFAVITGGFGIGFHLDGIDPTKAVMDPVTVQVHDVTRPEIVREVQVIAVISLKASAIYDGLFLSPQAFDAVFPEPESSVHFVRLAEGADSGEVAKEIERSMASLGAQADSLRDLIDEQQQQSAGFLYLLQGFMAIGLFVGIAAVGVIAFRTVVERRQQIGMLRAIGYTRGAVALSFLMESAFVTLLGVVSGITLALLLAFQLVKTDDFVTGGVDSFYIPWVQILGIGGFALVASLVMTIVPSRQASSIPIAEALRYE
ncbi:MAG: FtsX-like permease family protein [Dehalococcoidia bacterium]